jgi:hypothetical protein
MLHQEESQRRYTGLNGEYIVIRDKAGLGMTMRDKTFSAIKIDSRRKERKRSDTIVAKKSKLTNRDHP